MEEMIRDRIVVGIHDHVLSELALEKAKTAVRQRAVVQEQQQVLKGAAKETAPLESLHTKKTGCQDYKTGYQTSSSGKPAGTMSGVNARCTKCGINSRPCSQCPASGVVCHKCGKVREVHPIPKVEDTLAKITGATIFSRLDANCGFWQIPLAKECQHLTTFITPFE